jgi:hypothetical protein
MEKALDNLINRILKMNHSAEEWFALEKEVNDLLPKLPMELEMKFTESGAGEALYMVCSGLRFEQSKND